MSGVQVPPEAAYSDKNIIIAISWHSCFASSLGMMFRCTCTVHLHVHVHVCVHRSTLHVCLKHCDLIVYLYTHTILLGHSFTYMYMYTWYLYAYYAHKITCIYIHIECESLLVRSTPNCFAALFLQEWLPAGDAALPQWAVLLLPWSRNTGECTGLP